MSRTVDRNRFLTSQGLGDAIITPLIPDASARCYFRISHNDQSLMLMDAPPALENPARFIKVTEYLDKLGARVPRIVAHEQDRGWVLLEDLGDRTLTRLLDDGTAESTLYTAAVEALLEIQSSFNHAEREIVLPPYDLAATLKEAELLTHWYLPHRLGCQPNPDQCQQYRDIWRVLYQALPPLHNVLVHRDFHVDNLLMVNGVCAMLDYQDALIGSPAYDLVSLLEDARRDVDPGLQQNMIDLWIKRRGIDQNVFNQHYRFWGAQRHCKVAGIFVRLSQRDGKDIYLKHLPRVIRLLRKNLQHPSLAALKTWFYDVLPNFDKIESE